MTLGKQVRHYRTGLQLTLDQLSEMSDVDTGTISALEQRNSKRSQYAAPIAKALGLTLEQLLDESTDHLPVLKAGGTPSSSASRITAEEAAPPLYVGPAWPFTRTTPSEWQQLDEHQKTLVEIYIRGLLDAAHTPRKRNEPRAALLEQGAKVIRLSDFRR